MNETRHTYARPGRAHDRFRAPRSAASRLVAGLGFGTALATTGALLAPLAAVAAEPDTTPPTITMAFDGEPTSAGWFSGSVGVTIDAADGQSGLNTVYLLDGTTGAITVWTAGRITRQFDEDGQRSLEAWAMDNAGNVSERVPLTVGIDTTAPTITVTTPTVLEQGAMVPMDFHCMDNLSDIALCDGDYGDGEALDTSQTGTFTTGVWARDKADNLTQIAFEYTVRSTNHLLPTIDFQLDPALPQSGWYRTPVDLTLTGEFPLGVGGVMYRATGAVNINRGDAGASKTHTFDTEGITDFTLFARDAEENESDPKHVTLRIDRTPPTVNGAADGDRQAIRHVAQGERVQFAPVCNDGLSGIASCTASGVADGILDTSRPGEVVLDLHAVDRAGNTATGEYRYIVDAKPADAGGAPGAGTKPQGMSTTGTATAGAYGPAALAATGSTVPTLALWGGLAAFVVGAAALGLHTARRRSAR